jgi:hypothetical protein
MRGEQDLRGDKQNGEKPPQPRAGGGIKIRFDRRQGQDRLRDVLKRSNTRFRTM